MAAPIVYFDIAGPDSAAQAQFYEDLFGWKTGSAGSVSVPVTGTRLPGTLRTDPAATVLYIGVPDIASKLTEVAENGGKVVAPRFEVKGVVVLGLFTDPAGNTVGLVEIDADEATVIP